MPSASEYLTYLSLLLITALSVAIYWATYVNKYWQQHNMPYISGVPFIGNFKDILLFKKCVGEKIYDFYFDKDVRDTAVFGIHVFHKPAVFLRDPELIKRILVKDFNSFSDRYSNSDIHTDVLGGSNLFFLRNPSWRPIRARLTPFFTSGKLKQMFSLMNDIGTELNAKLMTLKVNEKTNKCCTEIKDYVARYTTDVVASCAFGVQANSLQNPDSEFRKNGRRIFDFSYRRAAEFTCMFFLPELVPIFKFKLFTGTSTEFLRNTIQYVMGEREKSGTHRNDLIDTLITLKNDDKNKKIENTDLAFEGDVIVAQAGIFFTAGFETSSSALSFGLYELAKNPDMQKRLREEIRLALTQNNGELTYDSVNNMEYLNMILMETLRLYPILPFLDRKCNEKNGYSLEPYSSYKIPDGMLVIIPAFALHKDPKYFPNPDEFDPERFSPENRSNITPYTYMPFGLGPHNCIGERFGVIQTKIGFVNFLRNHFVSPSEKMPNDMVFDKKALILQSNGGIHLNVLRDPLFKTSNGILA